MKPPPKSLSQEVLLRRHHGEEDAGSRPEIDAALAADPAAREMLRDWQAQDAALEALFAPPGGELPEPMRKRLEAAARVSRPAIGWRPVGAGIALFAAGFALGWFIQPAQAPAGFDLAHSALNAHLTYAAEVAHPVEVPGSERDHLVRWLSKRLGQSIHVPDLGSLGFRLMGGRLLPGDPAPAALFMYENDAGQRLTIYVTPESGADTAFHHVEDQGQQGFWWTDAGLGCAIVAPIGRDALHAIALAAYDQLI